MYHLCNKHVLDFWILIDHCSQRMYIFPRIEQKHAEMFNYMKGLSLMFLSEVKGQKLLALLLS